MRPLRLALLVTALVAAAAQPAGSQAARPSAPLVRLPLPADDGSLTPYTFRLGYPLMTLVYDTLLWRDAEGVPRPWLARSVDTSDDGLRLTVRLAEGVRWHDGAPLTAADVAFTFAFVAERHHPRFTPEVAAVARVEVPDASTAVIVLRHPAAGFFDQPLADLPILPAHLWRGLPPGQPAPEGLAVGSGPYRLVEHRPGQRYRFEANAGYFRGPPAVQAIEVPVIADPGQTVRALERQRVDVVPGSLPKDVAARVERLGIRVVEGPSYLGTVLLFNLRSAPFDQPAVRRAVADALDLRRIADAAGGAVPADRGYLHPASAWSSSESLHAHDPDAARQVLNRGPLPAVQVLAPNNDPARLEASRQVALTMQRAGMKAESKALAPDELASAMGEDGSFPTFRAAVASIPALASYDPSFLARLFGSDPARAPLNVTGYASFDFDDRARLIQTSLDPEARRSAVAEALRLLATDVPAVPLFFPTGAFAYRPAAYDGWVFVKGSGILDKRSFLEPRAAPAQPGASGPVEDRPDGDDGQVRRFPFGLAALVLLGVAAVTALVLVVRGRQG